MKDIQREGEEDERKEGRERDTIHTHLKDLAGSDDGMVLDHIQQSGEQLKHS